jgi:hypothetical protein
MPAPQAAPFSLVVTRPDGNQITAGAETADVLYTALVRLAPHVPTDSTWEVRCRKGR